VESVQRVAKVEGVDLVLADNQYNSKVALRNVDMLIREGIDLAMEFQADEQIAPIISAKYREAGIPLIAIEIPHPGATFYGANNYEAGLIGGRYVARWAKNHWRENVDEVILLEYPGRDRFPQPGLQACWLACVKFFATWKTYRLSISMATDSLKPATR
jgi:ribose transport system substrate-binding protein